MTLTNIDCVNEWVYFKMLLKEHVKWQVHEQVNWQLIGQINPIKYKITQEINK